MKARIAWIVAMMPCWMGTAGATQAVEPVVAAPERIVSLAPSATETLYALGLGPKLVGRTDFCDEPPEVSAVPSVGGLLSPSEERILALAPDVIVATLSTNRPADLDHLRTLGQRIELLDDRSLDALVPSIERLGSALGASDRAGGIARDIERRRAALVKRLHGIAPIPVLFLYWHDPPMTPGRSSFLDGAISLAGGMNLGHAIDAPRVDLSMESVLAAQPRVVLFATHSVEVDPHEFLASWRRWSELAAVREHRLHFVPGVLLLRPGPRIFDAIELLAHMFHPEAFPGDPILPDIVRTTRTAVDTRVGKPDPASTINRDGSVRTPSPAR